MSAVFTAALIARHSEKAVSVNGEKKDDGTAVIQWPFQGGDHQKWNLEATTGGYYVVRAVHSGKALSVEGESTANGAKVIQWGHVTGPHQEWRLVQKDNGYFALQNRHSGQYLSVNGESTDNGTALGDYHGKDPQPALLTIRRRTVAVLNRQRKWRRQAKDDARLLYGGGGT
ncbi:MULTISPECIES: RICIN domain-containing protein [Streptomyces]|uniref:RICIN domain-containing protein n=1 Tax=Streptomyces flaveolus TaxID=67297 RepID=A0ABV3AQT0_9ACTN|nr:MULTISPECIES: RICIN domain-containing protein [Streptomyces]